LPLYVRLRAVRAYVPMPHLRFGRYAAARALRYCLRAHAHLYALRLLRWRHRCITAQRCLWQLARTRTCSTVRCWTRSVRVCVPAYHISQVPVWRTAAVGAKFLASACWMLRFVLRGCSSGLRFVTFAYVYTYPPRACVLSVRPAGLPAGTTKWATALVAALRRMGSALRAGDSAPFPMAAKDGIASLLSRWAARGRTPATVRRRSATGRRLRFGRRANALRCRALRTRQRAPRRQAAGKPFSSLTCFPMSSLRCTLPVPAGWQLGLNRCLSYWCFNGGLRSSSLLFLLPSLLPSACYHCLSLPLALLPPMLSLSSTLLSPLTRCGYAKKHF